MRQSKECGNDLDDGADKARAAIKTALVKLDIDIGGFVGMICQFADEETFTGSHRLEEYPRRGGKFSQLLFDCIFACSFF